MMIVARTETRNAQLRMAVVALCVAAIAAILALQSDRASASVVSTRALDCANWVNESFFSASPERDQAFVQCILDQEAAAAAAGHDALGNGNEVRAIEALAVGDDISTLPDGDCPYLSVSVESPVGSDEVYQRPMRDLFSAALTRAGFEVVDAEAPHYWWASILAMDTGPDSAVWTILVRAVAEIGDGSIQFTTVRRAVNGRESSFSGMQSLRAFNKTQAPEAALLAAAGIAAELLPAAHRRCSDIDGTLAEAGVRLEELQKELAEEIIRVRRERAEREKTRAQRQKQLQIEIEG